jgi:RNA polymerase sigma-70 factor (ECF subfamily)
MVGMKDDVPGLDVPGERHDTERELATAFRSLAGGDVSALDVVWERVGSRIHGLALWRTGNPEDAADVVQDVFIRIAERAHTIGNIRNPTGWLMTVTHRIAIDHIRRRKVRASESLEECHYLVDPATDPAGTAEANRASRLIQRLAPQQREAIFLRLFNGCTFAEIGKITGKPRFTAAGRYRAGIAKLRELFDKGES